jgi:hypothetical protein
MYTSHTANISNSFKKWSVAHSKRNDDNDQPSVGTPIALVDAAPPRRAELSGQAEHSRSFS